MAGGWGRQGLEPLEASPAESHTRGLDGLAQRCQLYHQCAADAIPDAPARSSLAVLLSCCWSAIRCGLR